MSAFTRALDHIGGAIVAGDVDVDAVLTVEQLGDLTGASRSIVREATRVLSSLGLITATQRIGMRVQPRSSWDLLDPIVVGWRLASSDRPGQLAELSDLRSAIEPAAARLAAERRSPQQAAELSRCARSMREAADAQDAAGFAHGDAAFHHALFDAAGNASLARLGATIETALVDRETTGRNGQPYDDAAIDLHLTVAGHVARSQATAAERAMRRILERAAG